VAGYCIYAGAELLDDLMDGDLGPAWSRYHPAEVLLAGTTLIATVPALALATAHAPPRTIAALQRSLARGLLTMSAGQQSDLALTGSADAPLETVDAIAQQKSGALPAMLAAMAARLANAPARVAEQYERLGRALGTARQFRSDCHDLFGPRDSRDLAHGARGLPIALHLQGLAGAERSAFVELLDTARQSVAARQAVRRRLLDTGVLRACALLIALYCAEAREALTAAAPRAPAARRLQGLIDEVSFFAGQTGAHTAALGEDDATRSVDRLR
jgi:geranylgeranyl pyrophosphate synthase